jgi:hypothetical protein
MAGTFAGGRKARATILARYGEDYYKHLGAQGGAAGTTGGFYYMKHNGQIEKLRAASQKGGTIGGRTPRRKKPDA